MLICPTNPDLHRGRASLVGRKRTRFSVRHPPGRWWRGSARATLIRPVRSPSGSEPSVRGRAPHRRGRVVARRAGGGFAHSSVLRFSSELRCRISAPTDRAAAGFSVNLAERRKRTLLNTHVLKSVIHIAKDSARFVWRRWVLPDHFTQFGNCRRAPFFGSMARHRAGFLRLCHWSRIERRCKLRGQSAAFGNAGIGSI